MNRADVTKILLYLSAVYGKQFDYPSGDEGRDSFKESVWHEQLKGFRPIEVERATKVFIDQGNPWPPHPGQIVAQIRRMLEPERISGAQAWQMTIQAIQRHSAFYGADKIKAELPPAVWNTVLLFGLENIANSDPGDTFLMSRFIKQYEQQQEIERERLLYAPHRAMIEEGSRG